MKTPYVETVLERGANNSIVRSTLRPATDLDLSEAALKFARGKCTHEVVWDEPGWAYDLRACYTCGLGLGAI